MTKFGDSTACAVIRGDREHHTDHYSHLPSPFVFQYTEYKSVPCSVNHPHTQPNVISRILQPLLWVHPHAMKRF